MGWITVIWLMMASACLTLAGIYFLAILADIRQDDERASQVIDRMRGLLKRQTLDARRLDVGALVGDVAALVRVDAVKRQVKLGVNVQGDLPYVRGDRVHLQQVLLNLILNGMDALNGASRDDRRVSVTARLDGAENVEIEVDDAGHGIPSGALARVFDPFFTTKPGGMGMGLAISRTIIEAHGGRAALAHSGNPFATLFLTGHGDIPSSVRAMRDGAEDFLEKRAPKEQILEAVTRSLARDAREREARARQRDLRARFDALTPREFEVLGHVVRGQLNKQIAGDLSIHERTVKLHRTAITTKLRVQSVAELTRLTEEAGFSRHPHQPSPRGSSRRPRGHL